MILMFMEAILNSARLILLLNVKEKTSLVYMLPNTSTAISTLVSVADAIPKRELRERYFESQGKRYFLPLEGGTFIPKTSAPAAAAHLAVAFRSWAERFDLPTGEADVLMSLLGTLGNIASADDEILDGVPIEERSKRALHAFFGSEGNTQAPTPPQVSRISISPMIESPLPPSAHLDGYSASLYRQGIASSSVPHMIGGDVFPSPLSTGPNYFMPRTKQSLPPNPYSSFVMPQNSYPLAPRQNQYVSTQYLAAQRLPRAEATTIYPQGSKIYFRSPFSGEASVTPTSASLSTPRPYR